MCCHHVRNQLTKFTRLDHARGLVLRAQRRNDRHPPVGDDRLRFELDSRTKWRRDHRDTGSYRESFRWIRVFGGDLTHSIDNFVDAERLQFGRAVADLDALELFAPLEGFREPPELLLGRGDLSQRSIREVVLPVVGESNEEVRALGRVAGKPFDRGQELRSRILVLAVVHERSGPPQHDRRKQHLRVLDRVNSFDDPLDTASRAQHLVPEALGRKARPEGESGNQSAIG